MNSHIGIFALKGQRANITITSTKSFTLNEQATLPTASTICNALAHCVGSCRRIKEYCLIVQQKNGDLRLSAYNKKREIESNSGKHYVIEANGNPKYFFRLEVRINGDTLREYFQHLGIEYNSMLFCKEDFLWRLFLDFANRVLCFQTVKGKQTLDVLDIVA